MAIENDYSRYDVFTSKNSVKILTSFQFNSYFVQPIPTEDSNVLLDNSDADQAP